MSQIKLVGTSHIAKQSVKEIKAAIASFRPDIVAVELDQRRLYGLLTQERKQKYSLSMAKDIGLSGYIFAVIGSFLSRKLGKSVGVMPGEDMLTAVRIAKEHKLEIALIDQDIGITLRNFSKGLSWKERFQFIKDIFKGIFFKKSQMKKYGLKKMDLSKVPTGKVIQKLLGSMKIDYPNIYKALVEDRNHYMAKKLNFLRGKFPEKKILAIVGAGHIDGMQNLIAQGPKETFSYSYTFGGTTYPQINILD